MVNADSASAYYDRYWTDGVCGWQPSAELTVPMRSLLARACWGSSVLDYGGGDDGRYGRFVRSLAEGVTVADVSPSVREARRRAGDHAVSPDELDLIDSSFDVLLMLEVLEHLLDPLATLKAATVHVRSGGSVLLSVPNAFSWLNRARMLVGRLPASGVGPPGVRGHTYDAAHIRFFDFVSFEDLIEQAGLEIMEIRTDQLEFWRLAGLGQRRLWKVTKRTALLAGTLIGVCRMP